MKIIYNLCIILLLFVLPLILCNQKVSTLNVLFPICISPKCLVVYQINAFNGCYKWNFENTPLLSSIQNHLKIIKSDEECNEKIELQSTVNQTFLNLNLEEHLWLIPTDINTGKQFKIRVGFSILTKISITKRFDIITLMK